MTTAVPGIFTRRRQFEVIVPSQTQSPVARHRIEGSSLRYRGEIVRVGDRVEFKTFTVAGSGIVRPRGAHRAAIEPRGPLVMTKGVAKGIFGKVKGAAGSVKEKVTAVKEARARAKASGIDPGLARPATPEDDAVRASLPKPRERADGLSAIVKTPEPRRQRRSKGWFVAVGAVGITVLGVLGYGVSQIGGQSQTADSDPSVSDENLTPTPSVDPTESPATPTPTPAPETTPSPSLPPIGSTPDQAAPIVQALVAENPSLSAEEAQQVVAVRQSDPVQALRILENQASIVAGEANTPVTRNFYIAISAAAATHEARAGDFADATFAMNQALWATNTGNGEGADLFRAARDSVARNQMPDISTQQGLEGYAFEIQ